MMSVEELIEIRPIPMGHSCRLGHIPTGRLQKLNQILLFKLSPCFGKGKNFTLMLLNGIMEEIFRNNR